MNCQEIQQMWDAYHDDELDAAFCRDIQCHLEICPDCRRFFESQQRFTDALTHSMRQGDASETFWQRETSTLRTAAVREKPSFLIAWRELLWPSPKFYGGLAAVWIVLLTANHWADFGKPASGSASKFTSEQLAAFEKQRREFNALIIMSDLRTTPPTVNAPGPRSDRSFEPSMVPVGLIPPRHEPQRRRFNLA